MNAKEYLGTAYRIDQRINSKLEQIMRLRELAAKATSTISGMPHSSSNDPCKMESVICKMADLENEINADIDSLVDMKRTIMRLIKEVKDPECQTVLELRYLCFKRWEAISVELNFSIQHAFRIRDRGIKEIDKILKDESKCDRM